jgi:hypothetical protein
MDQYSHKHNLHEKKSRNRAVMWSPVRKRILYLLSAKVHQPRYEEYLLYSIE